MAAIAMTDRPKRHAEVRYSIVPEGALVVHHRRGELKTLNPVGGFILDLLDGSLTVEDIVRNVTAEFQVSPPEAERDTIAFLDDLIRHEVVSLG